MAEENPDSSSKELAHMGADYAVNYLKDTFIDYDEDNEKAGKYNGKDVVMENDIIIDEMIRFIIAI